MVKVFNQTMKLLKLWEWLGQKLLIALANSNSDPNFQIISNCAPMPYRLKRKDIYPWKGKFISKRLNDKKCHSYLKKIHCKFLQEVTVKQGKTKVFVGSIFKYNPITVRITCILHGSKWGTRNVCNYCGELVTYIWPTLLVKVEIKKKCYWKC